MQYNNDLSETEIINKKAQEEINKGTQVSKIRLSQMKKCLSTYGKLIPPTPNQNKPTLVLDMDNTLLYSSLAQTTDYDFIVYIQRKNKVIPMQVKMRPHLEQFLDTMSQYYEIVLFSAGCSDQAEMCVEKFDLKQRIDFRLQRDACTKMTDINGRFQFLMKDLDLLGRDLSKVTMVDDKSYSFCKHPNNGYLIKEFRGESEDVELVKLADLLVKYQNVITNV